MTRFVLSMFSLVVAAQSTHAQPPREKLTLDQVRFYAQCEDFWVRISLSEYGAELFPMYQAILSDPNSDPKEVCGVLSVLCGLKCPKGEFLELAVPFLAHKDYFIRVTAAGLMRDIATPNETSILIALLSDKDSSVAISASIALEKRGGARELVALDAWLLSAADREKVWLVKYVRERRAGLATRLEAEKKEREKAKDKK